MPLSLEWLGSSKCQNSSPQTYPFVKPSPVFPVLPIIPNPILKLVILVSQSPSLYLYQSTDSLRLFPDDEFLKGSNSVSHFCILRAVSSTLNLINGPSIPFSVSIMHKRDGNWQRRQIWCLRQVFMEFWLPPRFWAATQYCSGMALCLETIPILSLLRLP